MGRAPGNRDEWWGAAKGTGAGAGADAAADATAGAAASLADEPRIPFDPVVLAVEPHVLVVDKPPFLASTPNGRLMRATVQQRLRDERDEPDLTCIHRLDRLTSGVMLVARDAGTRGVYQRLFQDGEVAKTYECLTVVADDWAVGETRDIEVLLANVPAERGVRVRDMPETSAATEGAESTRTGTAATPDLSDLPEPPHPEAPWRAARTRITYLGPVAADIGDVLPSMFGGVHGATCACGTCGTRMTVGKWRLEPATGRTHQLRATMAHLGYPILGDDTYPEDLGLDLGNVTRVLRLVATDLLYDDPLDGLPRTWRSRRDVTDPAKDPVAGPVVAPDAG